MSTSHRHGILVFKFLRFTKRGFFTLRDDLGRHLYLLEELERALLGDVAQLAQTLDGLLSRGVLLLADDAASLRLHQVCLLQTTGRVLSRTVENLGSATHRHHGATLLALLAILTSHIRRHLIFIRKILL